MKTKTVNIYEPGDKIRITIEATVGRDLDLMCGANEFLGNVGDEGKRIRLDFYQSDVAEEAVKVELL